MTLQRQEGKCYDQLLLLLFFANGYILRQMLCITKVPDETLRLANWVDVYAQNQIVLVIIIFVYGILIQDGSN